MRLSSSELLLELLLLEPDLDLEWSDEFILLDIQFDAFVNKMERNFDEKIQKVLGAWFNIFLRPYGKITLINKKKAYGK